MFGLLSSLAQGAIGSMASGAISSLFNGNQMEKQADLQSRLNREQAAQQASLMSMTGMLNRKAMKDQGVATSHMQGTSPMPSVSSSSVGSPGIDLGSISSMMSSMANLKTAEANKITASANQQNADTNANVGNSTIAKNTSEIGVNNIQQDYINHSIMSLDEMTKAQTRELYSRADKEDAETMSICNKLPYELEELRGLIALQLANKNLTEEQILKVRAEVGNIHKLNQQIDATIANLNCDSSVKKELVGYYHQQMRVSLNEANAINLQNQSYNALSPEARAYLQAGQEVTGMVTDMINSVTTIKANFAPATRKIHTNYKK